MQRTPPPLDLLDLVTFAINPQVHAFDNASIVETLGSARRSRSYRPPPVRRQTGHGQPGDAQAASQPLCRPASAAPLPGELPPQVDPRQMSLLGAGWTAGSLKYLAESDAQSITYYETTGWRGVMETASGSPLPELFHSKPSSVFPLYHVLADYGEFAGGEVIHSRSSNSLAVDGIALRKEDKTRLILANFTAEPQPVSIQGLDKPALVRALDETNAGAALLNPEQYRAFMGSPHSTTDGLLQLTLLPYAVVRIDG